jgi:3',5'-cyclic AMP phosphodiesterase CpdA
MPRTCNATSGWPTALALALTISAGALVACEGDPSGGPDAAVADARPLPDVSLLEPDPTFDSSWVAVGADRTVTTLVQTERPRYAINERFADRYGRLRVPLAEIGKRYGQPGEPAVRRDDLLAGDRPDTGRRSLAYLLHLSDAQLVDVQSPAYVPKNKYTTIGDALPAFQHHGPLSPHLLDAALQTGLAFAADRPFDVVLHTGDALEDSQQNELAWFLTVMNGGTVSPDSGAADDPKPGPRNDAFDPFVAAGLPPGTPWLNLIGNHDILVEGNFPAGLIVEAHEPRYLELLTDRLALFGAYLPGVGTDAESPNAFPAASLPAFTVDPEHFDREDMWEKVDILALEPGPIVADPARAFVDGCGFIAAHRAAAGTPVGHGFTAAGEQTCLGNYTWDLPDRPVRFIALDTGPHIGGSQGSLTPPLLADGSVDESRRGDPAHDQIAWLVQELDRATTDRKAIVVLSHHGGKSINKGSLFAGLLESFYPDETELLALWSKHFIEPAESMSGAELRDLLASYPNVILHLVGHTHENAINAVCPDGSAVTGEDYVAGTRCAAPAAPRTAANGYWEVVAASVREPPHHFRITEIVDNGDGTGSVLTTLARPQGGAGSLHDLGLFLALAEVQLEGTVYRNGLGTAADRNAELRFAWSEDLVPVIATAEGASEISSETTLATPAAGLPTLPGWP